MIALQLRGERFTRFSDGSWSPFGYERSPDGSFPILQEIAEMFNLEADPDDPSNVDHYLYALEKEGESFRQRFVDYTPRGGA